MYTLPVVDIQGSRHELYNSAQRVNQSSVGGKVFTAQWCIVMRVIPSRTPSEQGTAALTRMCT